MQSIINNRQLIDKIKSISEDIYNYYINHKDNFQPDSEIKQNLFSETFDCVFFSYDINCDFIDKLLVFIEIYDYQDSMFIDDILMITSSSLVENKFYIRDKKSSKTFKASLRDDKKYNYASVLLRMPATDISANDINIKLTHELQHISDSLHYKSYSDMNSDIIISNEIQSINSGLINNMFKYIDIDEAELTKLIKKCNIYQIAYFFKEYICYFCNVSEMHARLTNFYHEIHQIDNDSIEFPIKTDCHFLRKYSETYNTYYIIYKFLICLIDNLNRFSKNEFAKRYIQTYFDYIYNSDKMSGYVYKRNFKNINGKYNEDSFDEFCKFHIDRIYNLFLSTASEFVGNNRNLTEHLMIHSFEYRHRINTTNESLNILKEERFDDKYFSRAFDNEKIKYMMDYIGLPYPFKNIQE